jgi:hypothetical protein
MFITREKGRNAAVALEQELADTADSILELVNGAGKDAAKTGENWDDIAAQTAEEPAVTLKDTGRPYPRPVFSRWDTGDRTVTGWEAPAAAIDGACVDRFYAGYDELLEYGLENGPVAADWLADGFDEAVDRYLDGTRYRQTAALGDTITWGVMDGSEVPDATDTVLVPDDFTALGTALAEQRYGDVTTTPIDEYAAAQNLQETGEEAIIAAADCPGMYMYDSGGTAEAAELDYEPVLDGAVSRLGRFDAGDRR